MVAERVDQSWGSEGSWASAELLGADFGDRRLNARAEQLLEQLGAKPSLSIPAACGGWAETQGAYRFLANEKVSWEKILEPHGEATRQRLRAHPVVLAIQDTTELDFGGKKDIAGLGPLSYAAQRGMYVHPTLLVTPERVSLGVWDAWMWARDADHHGRSQERRHWPIEAKESMRWVEGYERVNELAATEPDTQLIYIADRESDIYEVFEATDRAAAQGRHAEFLIRAVHDRVLLDEQAKLKAHLAAASALGTVTFHLPRAPGRPERLVTQTLRATRVTLKAPRRTGQPLAPVTVTAVLAEEQHPPAGTEPLRWLLLTSLAVETREQVLEVINYYLARWEIELFFRVLKGGCQVEALQLEALSRLEPALALYMIVAWRVLYLMRLGRQCPELPCDAVFEDAEWRAVYLVTQHRQPPTQPPPLADLLAMVARLGGHLGRKGDGPPGAKTLWIGLQRIRDFVLVLEAQQIVARE